jgi:hypothetical protein
MSQPPYKADLALPRRRYLAHLLCVHDEGNDACRYVARIQPWAARMSAHAETQERVFSDECELVETINPLLPRGSDVRDILNHIESPPWLSLSPSSQLRGSGPARLVRGKVKLA